MLKNKAFFAAGASSSTVFSDIYHINRDLDSGTIRVHKLDTNGNQITSGNWPYTLAISNLDGAYRITTDSDGAVYFTWYQGSSGDKEYGVIKLDSDGNELWTFSSGDNSQGFARDVVVGSDGFVYLLGATFNDRFVHKINASTGTEVTSGNWPLSSLPAATIKIQVDNSGHIYVGRNEFAKYTTSTGAEVTSGSWPISITTQVEFILPGSDGFVYFSDRAGLKKINASNGAQQWSFTGISDWSNISFALDAEGFIYFWDGNDDTIGKIDSDGNEIIVGNWPVILSDNNLQEMRFAIDGYLYISTRNDNGSTDILKYDTDGNQITSGNWPVNYAGSNLSPGIAVGPGMYAIFWD